MAGAIYTAAAASIARAFADARRRAGMRQADLADAIGKHQSYVSDIERGQRRIDVLELFVIARALTISPVDFYALLVKDIDPDFRL